MANVKHGAKARRILAEKENVANIAKWILIAFCFQFVIYLGLINTIPMTQSPETNELNSLYSEEWSNSKNSDGTFNKSIHTEGNGIKFIYGYNMVLLVCATGLVLYYAMIFVEEYEGIVTMKAKQFFIENKGVMFLVLFMIWTFISSCLAYDKFRSFIGCYNLRDGFLSFAFYGSILVCILLMSLSGFEGKVKKLFNIIEIDPKKLIVDIFVVVMTIIAIITILDYHELNYGVNLEEFALPSGTIIKIGDIGMSVEPIQYVSTMGINGNTVDLEIPRVSEATVTSSVFNNSNHYAYVLSIAVIVAAVMFIKTKSLWRIAYLASFVILTVMLIINDTFGAYLGIMIALALMLIHAIITISKEPEQFACVCISIILFALLSVEVRNVNNEIIVKKNFNYISQSISAILGIEKEESEEQETEKQIVDVSGEQYIVQEVIKEKESEEKNVSNIDASDAGSGRWKLWVGAWEIISSNYRHTQKYIESGDEKIVIGDNRIYLESANKKEVMKNKVIYLEDVQEKIVVGDKEIYIRSGDEVIAINDRKAYIESGDNRYSIVKENDGKICNITINKRFKSEGLGDRIKDSLFGDGLENFIYEYAAIGIGEGRSHNLILQLAGTVGIPGMLLYVLGVAFIFFKALKYFKVWDTYTYMGMFVMVSYLISSLTGNSGFYTSGYFYIFVGFVVVGTIALAKEKEENEKLLPKPQNEKNVIEVTDKKWRKAN